MDGSIWIERSSLPAQGKEVASCILPSGWWKVRNPPVSLHLAVRPLQQPTSWLILTWPWWSMRSTAYLTPEVHLERADTIMIDKGKIQSRWHIQVHYHVGRDPPPCWHGRVRGWMGMSRIGLQMKVKALRWWNRNIDLIRSFMRWDGAWRIYGSLVGTDGLSSNISLSRAERLHVPLDTMRQKFFARELYSVLQWWYFLILRSILCLQWLESERRSSHSEPSRRRKIPG